MCLPNFIEWRNLSESDAIIGYRNWTNPITGDNLNLQAEVPIRGKYYIWEPNNLTTEINESDSGFYAYSNYNNNYNNNHYNYNNYNYNNYNNYFYNNINYNNNHYNYNSNYYSDYNYNYCIGGIIYQFGKVAIHQKGQRSEKAKIDKLFTIRELDAEGPINFLAWIKIFNNKINLIAEKYSCSTIHWQDFIEQSKE